MTREDAEGVIDYVVDLFGTLEEISSRFKLAQLLSLFRRDSGVQLSECLMSRKAVIMQLVDTLGIDPLADATKKLLLGSISDRIESRFKRSFA